MSDKKKRLRGRLGGLYDVYRRTIPRAVRGRGNVRFSLSSVPLYEGSIYETRLYFVISGSSASIADPK